MPNNFPKNKFLYILLLVYAFIAAFTIYYFDGTADGGDSVHHYQFAKYAPQHPALFFDHWAKPVFVLLASSFAQFGFVGIKIFNALTTLFTLYFSIRIAQNLKLKNTLFIWLTVVFSPMYYVLTFSGLTEPLFALFLAIALLLVLKNKYTFAAIIVSFMPFVRSEGLIFIGIFGLFFLLKKQWKLFPWLLLGHVVYSMAGYLIYHDFLWIFTKIPYARLSSNYGQGELFHFAEHLIYVVGIPLYALFWVGFISLLYQVIRKKVPLEVSVLIWLGTLAFMGAHSLFWYLGIFNSMGLTRVLMGIFPLLSILILFGYNTLSEELLKNKVIAKRILQVLLIAYIVVFPFTSNPAAMKFDQMYLTGDQHLALEIADFIKTNEGLNHRFIFVHPYLGQALDIDIFDPEVRLNLTQNNLKKLKPGDIVIWENWFSVVECGISKQSLIANPQLEKVFEKTVNERNREIEYAVFVCR